MMSFSFFSSMMILCCCCLMMNDEWWCVCDGNNVLKRMCEWPKVWSMELVREGLLCSGVERLLIHTSEGRRRIELFTFIWFGVILLFFSFLFFPLFFKWFAVWKNGTQLEPLRLIVTFCEGQQQLANDSLFCDEGRRGLFLGLRKVLLLFIVIGKIKNTSVTLLED